MAAKPSVQDDLKHYSNSLDLMNKGDMDEDSEFKPLRLVHGIYGMRQGGRNQMARIKLNVGRASGNQMRVLADTSEKYANGISHITTRQAIQFHWVNLDKTPEMMDELEDAGMTTREACGNAVRGVVCSPLSGTLSDEPFDVQPYAKEAFTYFLRGPRSSTLPRKFKIAFTASLSDYQAFNHIQDVGVCAVEENGVQGFRVVAAGALGSSPQAPIKLYDCLPKEDLIPVCEAVLRVHHEFGNRDNRAKARLKFVLRDHGDDGFRKLFEDKLAEVRGEGVTGSALPDTFAAPAAPTEIPSVDGAEGEWRKWGVTTHREADFACVAIRIHKGDIPAADLRIFADLSEKYSNNDAAVSVDQNLYFRKVAIEDLSALYAELVTLGYAEKANHITDVLSCPGAATCQLGITQSKNMATELGEKLQGLSKLDEVMGARIKISGCPNSCGHHHIGNIGLHGAAAKIGDKLIPHYVLLIGGDDSSIAGGIHHATMVARIPARKVVDTITEIVRWYEAEGNGQPFTAWLRELAGAAIEDKAAARAHRKALRERLEPIFQLAEGDLTEEHFYDIGDDEKLFSLEELGAGECMS